MSAHPPVEDAPTHRLVTQWVGLILGALFLVLPLLVDPPTSMSVPAWRCLGLSMMMAAWWATEAVPIPATALMPIFFIPILGLGSASSATTPYANPTIFLFMGGFILGMAMERWDLHRRIALNILRLSGSGARLQVGGFMIATAFISMWVSNTATAIMMLPIGMSIIALHKGETETKDHARFSDALLLGIAYGASLGGIATLIGTPPNALLVAFLRDQYGIEIGFGKWMLLGLPVCLLMLGFTWLWLTKGLGKVSEQNSLDIVHRELKNLGSISKPEIAIALVFFGAAAAWIFQPVLAEYLPQITDTTIAMAAALLLFFIPVNFRQRKFLMDWAYARHLPWGVLLLFGGGLSLAAVISSSGLAAWFADSLLGLNSYHGFVVLAGVVTMILFLTELTSNTATTAAFLPLVGSLAIAQGVPPQMFCIPVAIAASCAFMMPVATPPNAIIFGSGHMTIPTMMKAGFALNLWGVVVVTTLCYFLVGLLWPQIG